MGMDQKDLEDIKQALVEVKFKRARYHLPMDHEPGMEVPEGGSNCNKCEYYHADGGGKHGSCGNQYWQEYYETKHIPKPSDRYCCDWYSRKG